MLATKGSRKVTTMKALANTKAKRIRIDEDADFNPTKDIEELERLLAKKPQSYFTKIQVHSVIIKPDPFIHTQPMSPLYRVIKSSKSLPKSYKTDRDITSPEWLDHSPMDDSLYDFVSLSMSMWFINSTSLERDCNIDYVPVIRQLALKDEYGFVIHLESRLQ
nr:hypothetical protein [Tanacetum cinerariifolium]